MQPYSERIVIDSVAQRHVQAYLEYRSIVGDTDGGQLLSEEDYEALKKRLQSSRSWKNRLYCTWRNLSTGQDCKNIGPQSKCFCNHRYQDHHTDVEVDKLVNAPQGGVEVQFSCRVPQCTCRCYQYIPVNGSASFKCFCKHESREHSPNAPYLCTKCPPPSHRTDLHSVPVRRDLTAVKPSRMHECAGFTSGFTCACMGLVSDHATIYETRDQRVQAGKAVDNLGQGGAGYQGMGAITDFSSVLDGPVRNHFAGTPLENENLLMLQQNGGKLDRDQQLNMFEAAYKQSSSSGSRRDVVRRPSGSSSSSSSAAPSSSAVPPVQGSQIPSRGGSARGMITGPPNHAGSSGDSMSAALRNLKSKTPSSSSSSSSYGSTYERGPTREEFYESKNISHMDSGTMDAEDRKLYELEQELKSNAISEIRRYAVKKQLSLIKAQRLREERKAQQQNSGSASGNSNGSSQMLPQGNFFPI